MNHNSCGGTERNHILALAARGGTHSHILARNLCNRHWAGRMALFMLGKYWRKQQLKSYPNVYRVRNWMCIWSNDVTQSREGCSYKGLEVQSISIMLIWFAFFSLFTEIFHKVSKSKSISNQWPYDNNVYQVTKSIRKFFFNNSFSINQYWKYYLKLMSLDQQIQNYVLSQ